MKTFAPLALVMGVLMLSACTTNYGGEAPVRKVGPVKTFSERCDKSWEACAIKANSECNKMGYDAHVPIKRSTDWFGKSLQFTCQK